MKSEPRFNRAQPNIFPSDLGPNQGNLAGFDWVIVILILLPALAVCEGADLAGRGWHALARAFSKPLTLTGIGQPRLTRRRAGRRAARQSK